MWISPVRGFATGIFPGGSVGSLLPNIGLSWPPRSAVCLGVVCCYVLLLFVFFVLVVVVLCVVGVVV